MKISDVKKIFKEELKPSSLYVISIKSLRDRYKIPNTITDNEIIGIAKALHIDIFGESGLWCKIK